MLIFVIALPVALSIECHEWYRGQNEGDASTCEGGACVLKFNFNNAGAPRPPEKGCITDANVTAGCWDSVKKYNRICYCTTNLCNSDKVQYPEDKVLPAPNSTCQDPKAFVPCDSPFCVFTTDKNIDTCPAFAEPSVIHEYFTNSIVIDQTSILDKKKNTLPKSTFIAHCDSGKCTKLAKELSKSKNFTRTKRQSTCYSYQDTSLQNFQLYLKSGRNVSEITCSGDFCYMSRYDYAAVRGCMTLVDDSLAERKMENGMYDYLKLHFYLCSTDHCNKDDFERIKNATAPIKTTTTLAATTTQTSMSTGTISNELPTTTKPTVPTSKVTKTTTAPVETTTKAALPYSIFLSVVFTLVQLYVL